MVVLPTLLAFVGRKITNRTKDARRGKVSESSVYIDPSISYLRQTLGIQMLICSFPSIIYRGKKEINKEVHLLKIS